MNPFLITIVFPDFFSSSLCLLVLVLGRRSSSGRGGTRTEMVFGHTKESQKGHKFYHVLPPTEGVCLQQQQQQQQQPLAFKAILIFCWKGKTFKEKSFFFLPPRRFLGLFSDLTSIDFFRLFGDLPEASTRRWPPRGKWTTDLRSLNWNLSSSKPTRSPVSWR